jgi:2-phospho-L-lactate/phosphoenolpyruvate guanylyltransferase
MPTLAVLPIKSFDAAKQRLAEQLPAGNRRALAQSMCADVLLALRRAEGIDEVIVVTAELNATALASGHDVEIVDDPDEAGQSAAAVRGIEAAVEKGADRVLLVPGDCPALDPHELDALVARDLGVAPAVVIVPDRHGTGTNALLLSPPRAIDPAFGEGSFQRHRERAEAAGVEVIVDEVPSLALDVDTPEDLEALRTALESLRGIAPNTVGMLRQLARSETGARAPTG